nr:hypothetical protein [Tanacetum cinerariifolium]
MLYDGCGDLDDYIVVNNLVFRGFFEKQKLTGPNFIDWYRQLRILLSFEDKLNYLEHLIPAALVPAQAGQQVAPEALAAHAAWVKGSKEIVGLMLMTMDSEIQRNIENLRQSVSSYVLKMKSYIDNLERLGNPVTTGLGVSLILISLHEEFDGFVHNYNMHNMGKTINELHAMLKLHEQTLPKNNAPALHAIRVGKDGIFEIDLPDSYTNVSSIYALSNKRSKSNLDSALLWHCRLGHISKKRIEKLQHDGLFNSTDLRAFENCDPYVWKDGKKTSLTSSRKDQRSTWTNTHRLFQKEVENQLGKTIKLLRSNRGGEYISQEFFDHLKDHGIIAHRAPPYTPQHNGVSEKRNRTLLDMVRSMMSQITLPKFFWDYALETAACILNMVPTKKVEKTPYEVWHGQAPKLSCLKVWGCEALVKRDTLTKPDKLEPNSIKCIFVGYPKKTMGYFFYYPPENKSMKDNEVWDLVELPPNGKTVGSKWLFKKKTSMDGVVHTYKAHIRAIRILIAIAAFYDYKIWQMDVKTAFLNGYLFEEVYMKQPEGFVNLKYPNRVCKLKRSIYEIKQASRQWNKRFDDEIKKFGFTKNRDELCVYVKASGSNITFLILYVDDILIMGNNSPMLQDVKSYLERYFAMKDLGEASYILGIKIYIDKSRRLIGLCQSAYIKKILKRYHMENSKRGSILIQDKLRLSKSQGASTPAELKRMQNVPYALAVGSIIYAVRCRRPNVANTKDMFLVYIKRDLRVSCYTDVGYLTDVDDLKSQTGYVKFIYGLGVVLTIEEPIRMYCDNTGAITIANESGITKGARHFRAKVHYLREVIEYGDVKLEKVHTDDNLADPFTKALEFSKHSEHTNNIGMLPASSLM